ncbi:rRNA maturation RNase YbeY [Candidatus Kaiserbacteria bacterium]|nr:rRNA maturation RNase YbeY [Candidatus Kaiserbacteria bacterium]
MSGVSIKNFTSSSYIGQPYVFSDIAASVLPEWNISLVFVGAMRARALNKKFRGKNYVPNVLSYIAGEKSAEVIICPSEAQKQARTFRLTPSAYCLYLFIHAVLHIKGWAHGDKMEKCERDLLARHEKAHSNRNRHRYIPDKNSGG